MKLDPSLERGQPPETPQAQEGRIEASRSADDPRFPGEQDSILLEDLIPDAEGLPVGPESPPAEPRPEAAAAAPADRLDQLARDGRLTGDVENLRQRLQSTDPAARAGAEAELVELEREVGEGRTPEVRGGQAGPDQPTYEVKARTEPFTSQKNAQNWFNDRIKAANSQFVGQGTRGEVRLNLGSAGTIGTVPITSELAAELVAEALSKGGRAPTSPAWP